MAFGLAVYASPGSLPHHDARLAASCWSGLLDGLSTRKVPMKGFKVVDYISFSFPKLFLAQLHRPNGVREIASLQSSQNLEPNSEETAPAQRNAPSCSRLDTSASDGSVLGPARNGDCHSRPYVLQQR